ncbi:MAG: hypothetical protein EBT13_16860 [Rhodobacteraceae bacterium]|nr:hypothetical protein [Paracoccaceae bacterium]
MSALATLPRRRAETIARTEMLRASREAQRLQYESNPAVNGYRRVATQDSRVCLACLALSGTLHKTAEIMPSHPNCRCVMVPVTPSLAEITGDPSIPDLRPGAITSDNILTGLNEKEIVGIMGPKRYELFKNGTPLVDMVEVRMDPRWGPTTRVKPIKDIGQGPKPGPSPEPPMPTSEPVAPDVPRTPKPRRQSVPKQEIDNRDPEQVIAALRKIAGLKPGDIYDPAVIQSELEELYKERFSRKDAVDASNDPKLAEEFDKWESEVYKPRSKHLLDQAAARRNITKKHIQKMRDLLKSKNPIQYEKVDYDAVELERTTQVRVQENQRKLYDRASKLG